jgi:hypothetical protein
LPIATEQQFPGWCKLTLRVRFCLTLHRLSIKPPVCYTSVGFLLSFCMAYCLIIQIYDQGFLYFRFFINCIFVLNYAQLVSN